MDAYDYVIVGAGSAGCALAHRLSEDRQASVLLIEAGDKDGGMLVEMPKGFSRLTTKRSHAWNFVTEPQPHRNRGSEMWPRGRMMGGSSALNGMIYIRGQIDDYEDWEALGATGWGWRDMGRVFRTIEDHTLGASDDRGSGGPLTVTAGHYRYPFADVLIRAGEQMGLPPTDDFNGKRQEGVGYYAHAIRRGRRLTAARAFIDPIRSRPNLTILRGAMVEKVLIEDRRATGVLVRQGGTHRTIAARREVVLSAGALHSPKLLMLSGVGDGGALRRLGIAPVHDSPGVGAHMRDHVGLTFNYRLKEERSNNPRLHGLGLVRSVARYLTRHDGILSTGPFEIGMFACTDPASDRPDIQSYVAPVSLEPIVPGKAYMGAVEREPGLTVSTCLLHTTSEGSVALASPDPDVQVKVAPQWLTTAEDRAAALRLMHFNRRYATRPALAPFIDHETIPGAQVATDEQMQDEFDRNARTFNHATSTCRMGSQPDAVADARARVRGIERLRVADCSAMPNLISGNTSGPAMAVGWRAAELIEQDWR